jgi:hypothetical protein
MEMPNTNPPKPPGPLNVSIQVTNGQLGWAPDSLLVTSPNDVQVTFTLVNSPGAKLTDIKFTGSSGLDAVQVSDTVWQTTSYNPKNHKGKNKYKIEVTLSDGTKIKDDPDVNNEPPGGPPGDGTDTDESTADISSGGDKLGNFNEKE